MKTGLRAKAACVATSVVLILSGLPARASAQNSSKETASALTLNEEMLFRFDGEDSWFSFTPDADGRYYFSSSPVDGYFNFSGTKRVFLYDEELHSLYTDTDGSFIFGADLEADNTYYLKILPIDIEDLDICVAVSDWAPSLTTDYDPDDPNRDVNIDVTIAGPSEGREYTYEWDKMNTMSTPITSVAVLPETSSHYVCPPDVGGIILSSVTYNGLTLKRVKFINRSVALAFAGDTHAAGLMFPDGNGGWDGYLAAPEISGVSPSQVFCFYTAMDSYIDNTWGDTVIDLHNTEEQNYWLRGGLVIYSTISHQYIQCVADVYPADEDHLAVIGEGTDEQFVPSQGRYKVYKFTPQASGTYTFASAVQDQIPDGYTCPLVEFFSGERLLLTDYEQCTPENNNFSMTQHLTAGTDYYYVVSADNRLPEFNVSVTCDELDPVPADPATDPEDSNETPVVPFDDPSQVTPPPVTDTPAPTAAPVQEDREPERGVAGFVERLYTVALGRSSDPVGKQDWIDAITLRGETGASCARGFLYSPEFLNKSVSTEDFVTVLYRTFFDREPDTDGFNAWVAVLNNGTSKEEVIEGFINSTEWANLCLFYGIRNGGTGVPSIEIEPNQATIDFATRLYTTCLGRSADQAGLMAWARQLANQRDTGAGAARGFFFSSEFTGQNVSNEEYVNRLYRTFMGREADEAGFTAWVAQLDEGVSRDEVFEGFAQSPEFTRICASYGIIR